MTNVEDQEGVAGDGLPAYSIDELAAAAGLPSRTVRHYQSEGALPPPRRQGRIARYGPAHLDRLRLIGRLQDRGLRLDAIRDALREVERGHLSLEAWLGLSEQVHAPGARDTPVLLSEAELRDTFGDLPPGLVAVLLQLDFVRRPEAGSPGTLLVPSPALLHLAVTLHAAGIDLETTAGALYLLRKHTRRAADDVVSFVFGKRATKSQGSAEDVAQAVAALRGGSVEAAGLLFAQELERALHTAFEQGKLR